MIVITILILVKFIVNEVLSPLLPTAQIIVTALINGSDEKSDLM
jgi:hypothetical protein